MFVFVFALEVSLAGVNVSFALVVKVVLSFIFGHDITSLVYRFVDVCDPFCLIRNYGINEIRQCEPVGWSMVGESYHRPVDGWTLSRPD